MNDQFNSGSKAQGNMAPNQQVPFGYIDPRSQRSVSGRPNTINSQQPPSTSQQFNAASWSDPMSGTEYYGNTQYAPQNASSNPNSFMPNSQHMFDSQQIFNFQHYPATNFSGQNLRAQFNPAEATFHQWAMATSRQNNGFGSNMQYSGQQYPGHQAEMSQTPLQQSFMSQTQFQQTPVQQDPVQQTFVQQSQPQFENHGKQEAYIDAASYDDYAVYDMDDDPSAQLLGELNGTSRPPTPQTHQSLEISDNKDIDMAEDLTAPMVDPVQPADGWSNVLSEQPVISSEGEIFKSFGGDVISSEADKILQRQLEEQVDQVVEDLDDEDMQDIVSGDQTVIGRTPEHTYITTTADHDQEADGEADDYVEDSVSEEELEGFVDHTEKVGDLPIPSSQVSDDVAENVDSEEEDDSEDEDTESRAEQVATDVYVSDAESIPNQEAHDSAVEGPTRVNFEGYTFAVSPFETIKTSVMSKEDKELHQKATKLIPHHLPPTRYWAAVLHHSVQPNKAKVEKDFIWMKGSRFNTVETIYNKYKEVTTEDRHQLLFCNEPPEFHNVLEELDIFDDKLVVFRARVVAKVVIEID